MVASSVTSRGSSRAGEDAAAEARCRAARDKLRIVREAMEANATHLQALDAYEVEKAAYLARRAPLDAAEEARRARSEAAAALAEETGEGGTPRGDAIHGAHHGVDLSREHAREEARRQDEEAFAAYEEAVAALGPVPAPPPFRDHLNDARVAADGTDGPPLFLLTCGVLEGAGERGVALLKELMARGARAKGCVGSRPNHGERLAPLCLALAHLERFADPGDPEPEPGTGTGGFFGTDALLRGLGIVPGDARSASGSSAGASWETSSEGSESSAGSANEGTARKTPDPGTPRSVARFGSEGSESGAEETEAREEKTRELSPPAIETERVVRLEADDVSKNGATTTSETETGSDLIAPSRPARLRDVKNAITALIAGGADVNARCRLGAFRNGPHEMLARPFRAVCAYRGVAGTVGDALFLAAVAATSPATPLETRLECVDVAARLIASGADLEARGTRPGSGHGCGEDLAPLAMALAAMEQDACAASGAYGDDPPERFFEYALDDVDGNPNATLAAALLAAERVSAADSESYAESETSGKSSSRSDAGADADPTRVRLSAGRLDALVSALKHTHGRDVTREQARALVGETRDSHAYAVSESSLRSADDVSSETGDTRSREKEPAVDVGAVTTFAHVPTRREFRARRLAVGETGAAAPASGPPLWHAACAAAEGAGAPAVAAARKLLKLGADPDAVGSRPGHCLPGTPALAMCVAALRGRARHPSPRHDRDWWPASETDGEAAKVQVPSRRVHASSASSAVSSFLGSRAETLNPRRVSETRPEVSPAARHARAAFEAEVVRGLERFLENPKPNADRNAGPVSKPGADLVTGADARIGYWSRAIGAPFRWSARAEADAVASANAIAVAHRETRLAAVSYMRASVADLRAYVPGDVPGDGDGGSVPTDRSNREARARADALALAEALVAARADCDAPMKVVAKHAAALETDDAFPLGIAVGLFSESSRGDELARRAALALMDEGGADVSKRGVCAFPLVSSPLFAATRAIRRNVPQSVDLFRRLLEKGADVDGLGRFPEGSERTPLIELLHTLREGKVFRPGVLSLVRQLVEREKCDVRAPRPEVYLPTPHAAYAFREDEDPGAEPGASSRGELSHSETSASLLSAGSREEAASKYFASETGEDAERALRVRLSAARVDELTRTLSTRYGFDVTREQVRALVGETRDSHKYYAVSESSRVELVEDIDASASAASSGLNTHSPGPGALFPAWPPRVGRCEYAPLFWALEAVCGDGFDEARQAVELIAHALGGDVDAPQGTNHHSHVSGSIPAMATAAAIRAAAPLVWDETESVSSAAERRGAITRAESSEASESSETTDRDVASETESRVTPFPDALPNARAATIPGTDAYADAYAALAAAADDANAAADLSDISARNVRDIRDIRDVHGGSKLPPPADRSRFRSRARGVLGASRFEKATRAAAREKAREAAAARLAAEDAAALERREVARARAWRGAGVRTREGYEDARVVPAGASEDAPPGRLDAEAEALHADLDEIKKRSARSVAGDDVKSLSKAPPPGLMGALAALLGLDETEATSIGPEHSRDAEASARLARLERAASARAARLDASAKTAFFLLRLTKRIDATCVNPLLKEVGAASLAPFEHTPLFCALHGAATAAGAEQMALANQLATLCLDRGADVSAPGAHAGVGGDGFPDDVNDVNASPLRSYPLMWAVAAALRADTPNARVDDALALVRRLVAAGADPAAANFAARLSRRDESRGKEGEEHSYASKVLHLWDERALLLEVFDQREWQRVMTLRLDLQRVLGEAGARATFRAESGMRVVARRAAPSAGAVVPVPGAPRNEGKDESDESYESSSLERLKWAEGVRRTRELLEHGGVPSQYAVWVWPTTEREAFPPGDRLGDARRTRQTKNARNASFERKDAFLAIGGCAESNFASEFEYAEAHRAPRPFGAPVRECEIEVMPRRADLRRPGARGAVDVTRVRAEDVFEEELSDGSDGLNENPFPFRALTSRLLWEARVDGVPERADAARRASVLAVRELLAGEPAEPPASSDSSDAEPAPVPSASESDASEYESRFAFVPEAPRRRSRPEAGEKKPSRGVVHAALVFMGFRKKKRRKDKGEKKPAEDAEGDDDDARRAAATTTTRRRDLAVSNSALKPPHLSAPKEPFRKTLAEARDEALGSVAEALMRNPNSAQADRFHGVPSLAAMARAETSRRDDTTRRAKLSSTSREKTELADDFADPPPPAFGALGRYMQAVEREEAPDWNAATRRPMRRLLT